MKKQSGFTLIELAIVLVIIGLLLGGVLKGQELINSAKVKNFASDFRNIPIYIYAYQDKFRALPGDDSRATTRGFGAVGVINGNGNGALEGKWTDNLATTSEAYQFWQHVRLAALATGSTNAADADWRPTNADGNPIGIQAGTNVVANSPIRDVAGNAIRGSYIICSQGVLGKYVSQLDVTMDDGNSSTGSMLAAINPGGVPGMSLAPSGTVALPIDPAASYIVCFGV